MILGIRDAPFLAFFFSTVVSGFAVATSATRANRLFVGVSIIPSEWFYSQLLIFLFSIDELANNFLATLEADGYSTGGGLFVLTD